MQPRPEPLAEMRPHLSASAEEHVLGPVDSSQPGTPALTRHRRPLPALTGLRFFAAVYVVFFHTRLAALLLQAGHPFGSRFFSNGYLAVALFFLLSGFILAYTYRGQMSGRRASARFWEARFARLWPAYAFSLLCSSIPSLWFPSFGLTIATLCMVQAWNPWHPEYSGNWNFVCWTLSVEAFFYVLFPFVQRSFERLKLRSLAIAGSLILLIGVAVNSCSYTLSTPIPPWPWNRIPLPVAHLPDFLVGVALGNVFVLLDVPGADPANRHRRRWPTLTSLGLILCVLALATVHGALTSLALAPFTLLVAGLARERSTVASILSTPPLLLGGAISYSIYLLQTPVRGWVHALPSLPQGVFGLVFVPIVLLPIAYLVYRFVEEPSRAALRRLFAHWA